MRRGIGRKGLYQAVVGGEMTHFLIRLETNKVVVWAADTVSAAYETYTAAHPAPLVDAVCYPDGSGRVDYKRQRRSLASKAVAKYRKAKGK